MPKYLPEVPADPFDRQPMRYKFTERGLLIYSVNENKVDDGGVFWSENKKPRRPDVGIELLHVDHRKLKWLEEKADSP